jgi:hypothetical protein
MRVATLVSSSFCGVCLSSGQVEFVWYGRQLLWKKKSYPCKRWCYVAWLIHRLCQLQELSYRGCDSNQWSNSVCVFGVSVITLCPAECCGAEHAAGQVPRWIGLCRESASTRQRAACVVCDSCALCILAEQCYAQQVASCVCMVVDECIVCTLCGCMASDVVSLSASIRSRWCKVALKVQQVSVCLPSVWFSAFAVS